MVAWLRRVTPDLFLAAVVALVITLGLSALDRVERQRIADDLRSASPNGLSFDERLQAVERSISRSVFLHLPLLVVGASVVTALACRNRRWAWLTSLLAVVPSLLLGGSFFIDLPATGSAVIASYVVLSIVSAHGALALRARLLPVPVRRRL
jgi:hypothetical protein